MTHICDHGKCCADLSSLEGIKQPEKIKAVNRLNKYSLAFNIHLPKFFYFSFFWWVSKKSDFNLMLPFAAYLWLRGIRHPGAALWQWRKWNLPEVWPASDQAPSQPTQGGSSPQSPQSCFLQTKLFTHSVAAAVHKELAHARPVV